MMTMPLMAASAAYAQASDPPPQRTITVTVYGDDKCPQGADDEIVVCARQPETERYRIPKKFRQKKKDDSANGSWASRVEGLDEAARPMRPGGCSVNGSFGQTGCTQAMLRQWFAEKRAKKVEEAEVP